MSALQTIIEKGYINDVILDEDLLQIELKSNELSSVEKDTLALINLGQPLNGSDVFAHLYQDGVIKEAGKSSMGWCIIVDKSLISKEDMDRLKDYTTNNMPIGNNRENRERINGKGLPKAFQ